MKVLVTRPTYLATSLSTMLYAHGFMPILCPVFKFVATPHQAVLKKAICTLPNIDIAIFTSQAAVHYGLIAIETQWSTHFFEQLKVMWFAIGPGTKRALESRNVPLVLQSLAPPYESESLLSHPALEQVARKRIFIFTGNTGRTLLADTLEARGAHVTTLACYERHCPHPSTIEYLQQWQDNPPDVTLITSGEGLNNLVSLSAPILWAKLKNLPMVVVGLRSQALAVNLGVKSISVAEGADNHALIHVLLTLRDRIHSPAINISD